MKITFYFTLSVVSLIALFAFSTPSIAQPPINTPALNDRVPIGIGAQQLPPLDLLHIHGFPALQDPWPHPALRIDIESLLGFAQLGYVTTAGQYSSISAVRDAVLRSSEEANDLVLAATRPNAVGPDQGWATNGGRIRLSTRAFPGADQPRMTILSNGNIGIGSGMTTPEAQMEMSGLQFSGGSHHWITSGTPSIIGNNWYHTAQSPGGPWAGDFDGNRSCALLFDVNGDLSMCTGNPAANGLIPDASIFRVIMDHNGNFGIGWKPWSIIHHDPTERLQVLGDARIGDVIDANSTTQPAAAGYGNQLIFSGGPEFGNFNSDNSDPLWMARFNTMDDGSSLRVNIGDNTNTNTTFPDLFDVGVTSGGTWTSQFSANCLGDIACIRDASIGRDVTINRNAQINGNLTLGSSNTGTNIAMKPGGGLWTAFSDIRLKKEVHPFMDGLEVLLHINPVRYHYNGHAGIDSTTEYFGVIAQEIQKVAPYTIGTFRARYNKDDVDKTEFLTYDASAVTYVIINAVKEMKSSMDSQLNTIQAQETEINSQRSIILAQQRQLEDLSARLTAVEAKNPQPTQGQNQPTNGIQFFQNDPNPFTQSTGISYFIPENINSAELLILDMNGSTTIISYPLQGHGLGQQHVDGSSLQSGTYLYTIHADGQTLPVKKMTVIK
jgi:hypothetical protein